MRLARKQGINIVCIVVADQYNPCGWAQALVRAQGGVARVLNASPKELAAVLHLLRTSPGANHPAARPSSHPASMLPAGAGAVGGEGGTSVGVPSVLLSPRSSSLGLLLSADHGQVRVTHVSEGGSAARQVRVGDVIVSVDGVSVQGMSVSQVTSLIRGNGVHDLESPQVRCTLSSRATPICMDVYVCVLYTYVRMLYTSYTCMYVYMYLYR